MKNTLTTLSIIFLAVFSVQAFAADPQFSKKELKVIEKALTEQKSKKIFKKNDRIAPIGLNLNFRVAAQQTEQTSRKTHNTKFDAIAKLEGVDDAVFQDITNTYRDMVVKRFQDMGMTVVPYAEMETAKSYAKLTKDAGGTAQVLDRKLWGVEKQFVPEGQKVAIWFNQNLPFGAQRKVPNELDAILYNSFIRIDFAQLGVEVSGSKGSDSTHTYINTEGKSSIAAVVNIAKDTLSFAVTKKGTHNLSMFGEDKAEALNVVSGVEYADSVETCKSGCDLGFKTTGFWASNRIDTVVVTADPVKYKAAVLDALEQYLDKQFALYQRVRG